MLYHDILFIDDDEDDRELFQSVLSSLMLPLTSNALEDARCALEKLGTNVVKADLIFVDLNMPHMSGQQFLQAIKKTDGLEKIPVIVLSTSSNPDVIRETKQLGAVDFVTKPSRMGDLEKMFLS